MPGWFIHMDAARLAVQRMRDGDGIPAGLNFTDDELKTFGELGHKWRNYLAIGSLGPDLFFLLPDFQDPYGNPLLNVVKWMLEGWEWLDDTFVGPWEEIMAPIETNSADLAAQLTGGLSQQYAQICDELNAAEFALVRDLVTRLNDWFGMLSSGVSQGFADSGFYWSDMLHYRKTYEFARTLFSSAKANLDAAANPSDVSDGEAQVAFALGWITHCATDVTGHPFTNAKSGGPYRLHWQRHHLVENHMDAAAYNAAHGGNALYEELGKSALHFRVAFRTRTDAPQYAGRSDAPAYDYFDAGFPAYPTGDFAHDDEQRRVLFDMDPGELPPHLRDLISTTMRDVYGDDCPKVLLDAPSFTNGSGRPNDDALNEMWNLVFRYLRLTSSDSLSPWQPHPPQVIQEHAFPTPPGGAELPEDDDRGAEPGDDTNADGETFSVADFVLGIVAWVKYIGQVIEWLLTILPGLAMDVVTVLGREIIYYLIINPLYSLYMATRKLLAYEGFLAPRPEETDPGLMTLGVGTAYQRKTLIADLSEPSGMAMAAAFDEPSGRAKSDAEFEVDSAFPRQTVRDLPQTIEAALAPFGTNLQIGSQESYDPKINSHWVAPWQYPESSLGGETIGWEPHLTHVGPWMQGDDATKLLEASETDLGAARRFERARTPEETADACHDLFPRGRHLGNPIDYSLYLIRRLTSPGDTTPDFNWTRTAVMASIAGTGTGTTAVGPPARQKTSMWN